MTDKIYLGKVNKTAEHSLQGENVYLEKHEWQCGWYWAFGCVGNLNVHTHFDHIFLKDSKVPYEASKIFENPQILDADWWVVRDLFVQAYALKSAAAIYQQGGHQVRREGVTDLLKNENKAAQLNADLELVLTALWKHLEDSVARQKATPKTKEV